MGESRDENIQYKFELKKVISDDVQPTVVINSETCSDPLVDDLDLFPSTLNHESQESEVDKDISYSDLYSKDNEEAKFIEENIDLYNDLLKIEEKEKKAKQIREMEFENCKKELKKFKELDVQNKATIKELSRENNNLKRSISSFYRTAKREIEFKDQSLAEANNEIIRLKKMTFWRNELDLHNEKCPNCDSNTKDPVESSNTSKRKRSESPEQLSKKKDYKPSTSKVSETDVQSHKYKKKIEESSKHEITQNIRNSDKKSNENKKDDFHKQSSKNVRCDKEIQTFNQCVFCQSQQNSNSILFNLIPDSLKKSIFEFEKDQVNSLNKFKEALINQYFNSKKQDTHTTHVLTSDKNLETLLSPKTITTPTSQHCKNTESVRKEEILLPCEAKSVPVSTSECLKKAELVRKEETLLPSKTVPIPTSTSEQFIVTESVRKDRLDHNETKKDWSKNGYKIPKIDNSKSKEEKLTLNKNSENALLSATELVPISNYEHYRKTELDKRAEIDKNEAKRDCAQNNAFKIPKNCYNSRLLDNKNRLVSNKSSENASSSRTELTPTPSFEHPKRTESSSRRLREDKFDKTQNSYISRQNRRDLRNLYKYREQKIPFQEKKKYRLRKKD